LPPPLAVWFMFISLLSDGRSDRIE
jgi:hypothetical protein